MHGGPTGRSKASVGDGYGQPWKLIASWLTPSRRPEAPQGRIPVPRGERASVSLPSSQGKPGEQSIAKLTRIDDRIVREAAAGDTDARACSSAKRARSSGSATALPSELAGSAPSVIEGNARVIVWPSNGFMAMIDDPKPNALRRVT